MKHNNYIEEKHKRTQLYNYRTLSLELDLILCNNNNK